MSFAVRSGSPSGRFGPEEQSALAALEALAVLVDSRDVSTSEHSARVGELARDLALELGWSQGNAEDMYLAGKLHDVGKVAMPDSILRKRGELTDVEWTIVRRHPLIGAELVSHIDTLAHLAPIIRGHHERYDGDGYPDGLCGEEIPFGARVLAVADAIDAMVSDRSYCSRMTVANARRRLRECAGTQFDPHVVVALDRRFASDPAFAEMLAQEPSAGPSGGSWGWISQRRWRDTQHSSSV